MPIKKRGTAKAAVSRKTLSQKRGPSAPKGTPGRAKGSISRKQLDKATYHGTVRTLARAITNPAKIAGRGAAKKKKK